MKTQRGFTIVEVLIVIVIAAILVALAVSVFNAVKSGNHCDMYRYSPINEVPASCVDYFFNGEGRQQ